MSQHARHTDSFSRCRKKSEGDVYHLAARGVAQQTIFEDDTDRRVLLELLIEVAERTEVEVYAWCFMSNHIHLLVHAPLEVVSAFMHDILFRYARYYNGKNARCGHLFQNRYGSSAIDSNEYLMTVVRYIHFNPSSMDVGDLKTYRWSSYREYLGRAELCSTEFVLDVFQGIEGFESFHSMQNDDQNTYREILEPTLEHKAVSDDDAIAIAKEMLGIRSVAEIAQADKEARDRMLALIKTRLTVRQIARVTGIGRNIVQRAK